MLPRIERLRQTEAGLVRQIGQMTHSEVHGGFHADMQLIKRIAGRAYYVHTKDMARFQTLGLELQRVHKSIEREKDEALGRAQARTAEKQHRARAALAAVEAKQGRHPFDAKDQARESYRARYEAAAFDASALVPAAQDQLSFIEPTQLSLAI